ncbi:MAG: hypothetical protein ACR2JW_14660 [Thermomicrobiales bacterium]
MAAAPTWVRHFAYAAATLFVWVFALMLFGALLGAVIGLFAPGELHGVGIGVMRGGGFGFAIGCPFYLVGVGMSVRDNLRGALRSVPEVARTEQLVVSPLETDAAAETGLITPVLT